MAKRARKPSRRPSVPTAPAPATAAGADSGKPPVKICFERIIPDDLDPERAARHALRDHMVKAAGKRLNANEVHQLARMAVVNTKRWTPGTTLRCRFLDGSPTMQRKVQTHAKKWEQWANIRLRFVSSGAAEIRISFYADAGSWSAVGRDALNTRYFPTHQPTMNYGWLRDDTADSEYQRVVLHEFGHALGCIHEHQSPQFTRQWNVEAVMKYFQGPPNYWDAAAIQHNVLQKYSPQGVSATRFDARSIMLYAFDAALFADGLGPTNSNTTVSQSDIQMIRAMYR